jgi:hypothetical protein
MLLLAGYATDHANNKQELILAVACIAPDVRQANTLCADAGYFSEPVYSGHLLDDTTYK